VDLRIPSRPGAIELSLYGVSPSTEVTEALASLVDLALDRATASEERARMDSAQRGEELRNTVLNALAHNFKTPLTCIKAAASMLRNAPEMNSAEGRDLVIAIDEEADHLTRLIGESLDLARIEAQRMNPRSEQCDLRLLLEKITARMTRYLTARQLSLNLPEALPVVSGDSFLLEQMFSQVLDNAWKYSKPGAAIHVQAATAGDRVFVTVRNEGSRIPAAEAERIFEKFYRGAGTKSAVEGTGLGLAIARSIAEVHGGALWLDQEPAGPAFRFLLPALAQQPESLQQIGTASDSEPHYIAY
jgi:two-component system sensor histidine kinase KdpD